MSQSKRQVYIKTLGCKVNSFDSHVLENQFRKQGYAIAESPDKSDIQVINSCSVTETAEKEARYLMRRWKREKPEAFRVMTGCYAQIHSQRISELNEVDFIVPNEIKTDLVSLVEGKLETKDPGKLPEGVKPVLDNKQGHFKSSLTLFDNAMTERTRAFLKIQDGCNGFCAYCQIPYARGASRSVDPQSVVDEVKRVTEQGVPEVVLTGIHLGDYGKETLKDKTLNPFANLLREILPLPGLKRLRISSLEPSEVSLEALQVLKEYEHKFCEHFHLPLQSGSERILKLMRRSYNKKEYADAIALIRSFFPNAHISADVICGFPQEGDEEFNECVAFIKDLKLGSLHVFPYSKRPNTAAIRMPGHIDPQVIKERGARLRALSKTLYRNYASAFVGESHEVLWENKSDKDGRRFGKTKQYLRVASPTGSKNEASTFSFVTLKGFLDDQTLLGH